MADKHHINIPEILYVLTSPCSSLMIRFYNYQTHFTKAAVEAEAAHQMCS